jgi:hypothetical protein
MTTSKRLTKDKAVNKEIRDCLKEGYTLLPGGHHVKIGCPDGKMIVVSKTGSTRYVLQYLKNDIKKNKQKGNYENKGISSAALG